MAPSRFVLVGCARLVVTLTLSWEQVEAVLEASAAALAELEQGLGPVVRLVSVPTATVRGRV